MTLDTFRIFTLPMFFPYPIADLSVHAGTTTDSPSFPGDG
jgi:hypothetical protein